MNIVIFRHKLYYAPLPVVFTIFPYFYYLLLITDNFIILLVFILSCVHRIYYLSFFMSNYKLYLHEYSVIEFYRTCQGNTFERKIAVHGKCVYVKFICGRLVILLISFYNVTLMRFTFIDTHRYL